MRYMYAYAFDLVINAITVLFFKQMTAYEMRISDWSSDVCSADLRWHSRHGDRHGRLRTAAGRRSAVRRLHLSGVRSARIRSGTPAPSLCWRVLGTADAAFTMRGRHLRRPDAQPERSEEHTSELQSLMRISYAVFCLKKKIKTMTHTHQMTQIHRHH